MPDLMPSHPGSPALLASELPFLPAAYHPAARRARSPVAGDAPCTLHVETGCPTDALARLLACLPEVRRVVILGRPDPLLNSDLPDLVGVLRLHAIETIIESDGAHLSPARQADLIESGASQLRIALPGARSDTYARLTGVDRMAAIVASLRDLAELKARREVSGPRVVLRCPARRDTLAELPALVRRAAELGAAEVYLERFVYAPGQSAGLALFGACPPYLEEILAEAEALSVDLGIVLAAAGGRDPRNSLAAAAAPARRPWQACLRPWAATYVAAAGTCYPCRVVQQVRPGDASLVMGNAFGQPFAEIWNGPGYMSFRAALLGDAPHPACAGCGVRWSL